MKDGEVLSVSDDTLVGYTSVAFRDWIKDIPHA